MLHLGPEIEAYESGELDHEETVALFQKLLDTGLINHLQGSYQHLMVQFITDGLVAA